MFMKRTVIALGTVAMIAICTATFVSVAYAANVHIKGGKKAQPKYTDNGLTLTGTASLAGLGNEDLYITIEAQGLASSVCISPGGSTQPPGQNPAPVTLSGAVSIPKQEIKNGSVKFTITTEGPDNPIPGAPGCPNPNWIQEINDIDFSDAKIIVEQPQGTVVLVVENNI